MISPEDRVKIRASILGLVALGLLGTLIARLWFLQVLTGNQYASAAERNRVRLVSVAAPRGRILDRNGTVLVKNRPSLAVAVDRDDLTSKNRARVVAALSRLLHVPVKTINARLADKRVSPYTPVVVAEDVTADVIFTIRERQDQYPGVETVTLPVRQYPDGSLGANILGYVGEINETQLKSLKSKGYRLGDQIGVDGVESSYEQYLRGAPGWEKLEVDASGSVLQTLGSQDPVSGDDVTLSIDARIQKVAEESILQGIQRARSQTFTATGQHFLAPAGAAVVLDAKTGAVVAMASYPTYDPSKFVGGVDPAYFKFLNDPANQYPLLDRASEAAYPPGSTFKPFMSVAALQSGMASASGGYSCTSDFFYGNRDFKNWTFANATYSLEQALVHSCDTVFYRFGANWFAQDQSLISQGKKPNETMQSWARRFGLGRDPGLDMPGDAAGRIPDRAWKVALWNANKRSWCANGKSDPLYADLCQYGYLWRGGDSVNMSIGQGDVQVTPLQLATAYAALANGGNVMQPHVAMKITGPDAKLIKNVTPRVVSRVGADPGVLAYVRNALAHVTSDGTGNFPFIGWPLDQIPVASKTGSAEIAGKQPFSWFASFAPANDPKYVVVSVVEQAGFGSQVSGPVVRRIMDALFDRPLTTIQFGARSD